MFGKDSVTLGDLLVDPQRRLVLRGEETIRLPKLSWDLLACLVHHSPGLVSTEQLLDEVWGDVVVGEETVKQRISLLRQALSDRGEQAKYIESIRGVGYRLIPPVEKVEPVEPTALTPRLRKATSLAAIIALALVVVWLSSPVFDATPGVQTVAVLPFDDMSASNDQDYFSDGMHEELIARLSRNASLAVTSRTSVLPYKNASMPLSEIAQELGAALVIEGSVRQADGRVRVTVQLIDAAKDHHLWAETYDRPLTVGNLFDIQDDIAGKVATALQAEIGGDAHALTSPLPTNSIAAYDNYLLGRYHLLRGNPQDLSKSLGFYEAAIAADPEFAEAHTGLGRAYAFIGTVYGWLRPDDAFARAEEHVDTALRINPDLADAHALHGDILTWYRWRWQDAETAYLNAIDAGIETDLGFLILLSVLQRHDEVVAQMDELVQRFPRDQWIRSNAAWRFLAAGRLDRAIDEATAAIDISDGHGDAYASRGWAYLHKGELDKAIQDFERNAALYGHAAVPVAQLAFAKITAGNVSEGRALLDEILQTAATRFVPPEAIAQVYVALGETDNAILWLGRAFEARSRGMIFLNVQASWDPIRDDPRFQELLRKMGLAQ